MRGMQWLPFSPRFRMIRFDSNLRLLQSFHQLTNGVLVEARASIKRGLCRLPTIFVEPEGPSWIHLLWPSSYFGQSEEPHWKHLGYCISLCLVPGCLTQTCRNVRNFKQCLLMSQPSDYVTKRVGAGFMHDEKARESKGSHHGCTHITRRNKKIGQKKSLRV